MIRSCASIVLSIQERIRWDKVRLNKIIESLDNQESGYTADDVVQQFNDRAKEQSFFDFMLNVIVGLRRLGKVRTSETYTACTQKLYAIPERTGCNVGGDRFGNDDAL